MNDFYTEQLLKRRTPVSEMALVVVLAVIGIAALAMTPMTIFAPLVAIVFLAVAIFKARNSNQEFEYLYMNGELDIDRIIAKSKRKQVFTGSLNQLELLVKADSHELDAYAGTPLKEFSSGMHKERECVAVYVKDGQSMRIVFEPNDRILEAFRMQAPRKVRI